MNEKSDKLHHDSDPQETQGCAQAIGRQGVEGKQYTFSDEA